MNPSRGLRDRGAQRKPSIYAAAGFGALWRVPRPGGGDWRGRPGSGRQQRRERVPALQREVPGRGSEAFERGLVDDDGEREVGADGIVGGRETGAGEAGVFGEGLVADVMIDFDRPVAAVPGEELFRGGAFRRRRGDAIGVFDAGFPGSLAPCVGAFAGDAEHLRDVRVVDQARQRRQHLDAALLDAGRAPCRSSPRTGRSRRAPSRPFREPCGFPERCP